MVWDSAGDLRSAFSGEVRRPAPKRDYSLRRRRSQCLIEVGEEIIRVFDPDRQAKQVGWAWRAGAFDTGSVLEQAFDATERRGSFPKLNFGGCGDGGEYSAFDADRKHRSKTTDHLVASDFVASETWQAGIEDLGNGRMFGESFGETLSGRGCPADSWVKCSQTAHQQPRLEGAEHSAYLRTDCADAFPVTIGFGGETGEEVRRPDIHV